VSSTVFFGFSRTDSIKSYLALAVQTVSNHISLLLLMKPKNTVLYWATGSTYVLCRAGTNVPRHICAAQKRVKKQCVHIQYELFENFLRLKATNKKILKCTELPVLYSRKRTYHNIFIRQVLYFLT
jgi:hypothetical protein